MIRTQISLTAEQMTAARAAAERRGVSLAALLREALDQLLRDGGDAERRDRARRSVGGFRSGRHDTADTHDDALAEADSW